MKKNTITTKLIAALILVTISVSSSSAVAFSLPSHQQTTTPSNTVPHPTPTDVIPYEGTIRVYIVEPVSRWINQQEPYHFGFLDFALETPLSMNYQDTYTDTVTWSGTDAGYPDITEDNIMAIAAVSNPERQQGYSNPPTKNPFDSYYVDATAAAYPGETGYNHLAENFTHTVFLIEATATYCPYCPATRDALDAIYNSNDYPFYYTALVGDKNAVAYNTLVNSFNLYGYPTCYFDDGYRTVVGGYDYESPYRNAIKAAGKQDVHDLNLSISLTWLGDTNLEVTVTIVNNELMENTPPEKPSTPEGDAQGTPDILYNYTSSTTDVDGNDVAYWFDWGDGNTSGWTDYKRSGQTIKLAHNWTQMGTYEIKVKAKDSLGFESQWSDPLVIEIPRASTNQRQQQILPQIIPKQTALLDDYATISFTVYEGEGCSCSPIPEADIWAFGLDIGHNDTVLTDTDGKGDLHLEYNAHYRLTVEKEGFQTVRFDFLVIDDQDFVIHLKKDDGVSYWQTPFLQQILSRLTTHLPLTFLTNPQVTRI
jgi:hypothetical protein